MSHPPPHIPGLEEAPGKDGANKAGSGRDTPSAEERTPEKKDKVCIRAQTGVFTMIVCDLFFGLLDC